MRRLIVVVLAVAGTAADKPSPPNISPELRAKFWRAQAEDVAAQARAQQTQATFQQAVGDLTKACGDFDLTMGQDGEPICKPKSVPAKAEKPAPK